MTSMRVAMLNGIDLYWLPLGAGDRVVARSEVRLLAAEGVHVRVFAPNQDDLLAMGYNVMKPARRREVLCTAQRTARARLAGQPSRIDRPDGGSDRDSPAELSA